MRKIVVILSVLCAYSVLIRAQELGANFNETTALIENKLVQKSGAKWVRGFTNIPRFFFDYNTSNQIIGVNSLVDDYPDIDPFLEAANVSADGNPVKLIYSLKLRFKHNNIGVPDAGSIEEGYWFDAIERLLKAKSLGNKISILVVGNEPMWETPNEDADKLKVFLERLINKIDLLRSEENWDFEIFIGALNRAAELSNNAILKNVLSILKDNAKVDGIDLHIHARDVNQMEDDLNFIRNVHSIDKKIISTEFSMVRMFDEHSNDLIGDWGNAHGYDPNLKIWEWLNLLKQQVVDGNPISQSDFKDFFESRSWYVKDWFTKFYNTFKKYNTTVITYRLQSEINDPIKLLNANSPMWLLNPPYCGELLGLDGNGIYKTNPLMFPEYAVINGASDGIFSQHERVKKLLLSPNPIREKVTIKLETVYDRCDVLNIYDIAGNNRISLKNPEVNKTYDIGSMGLSSGMYFFVLDVGKDLYCAKVMVL